MQSNRNIIIAIIIGVMIIAASFVFLNRPSNIDVKDNDSHQTPESESEPEPEQQPEPKPEPEPEPANAESAVKTIIQEYLTKKSPQISQAEKESIETTIGGYPNILLPTSEAITILATEGEEEVNITVDIKARDWAYATLGAEYTLLGGFVDGEEDKLDLGLYCYLEAATLNLNEPEFLSSIAFHLNNKGDYENAKTLLVFALSIDKYYYPALNNLAYAYAGQGDYTKAILEQMKVVSLRPEKRHLQRLAEYYEKAGLHEASGAILNAFGDSEEDITSTTPSITEVSREADAVLDELYILYESMHEKYIELWTSHQNKKGDLWASMQPRFDQNAERLMECWANSGGDPYSYCVECEIPSIIEMYNINLEADAQELSLIRSFESEAFIELENHTKRAFEIVDNADLIPSERTLIYDYIHSIFTTDLTNAIMEERTDALIRRTAWDLGFKQAMAEGCGQGPVEVEEVEEVNYECEILPILCKKWSVWFIIGSASYDPKTRNFDLSYGQIVSGKYRYNFASDVSSVGVGLGLPFKKILQFEVGVYFDLKNGLQSELTAGLSPPIPMYIPDIPTSVSISKPTITAPIN